MPCIKACCAVFKAGAGDVGKCGRAAVENNGNIFLVAETFKAMGNIAHGGDDAEAFTEGQLKICVHLSVADILAGSKNEHILSCSKLCFRQRERLFAAFADAPAGEIDAAVRAVDNFYPIGEITIPVAQGAAVFCHQLGNLQKADVGVGFGIRAF